MTSTELGFEIVPLAGALGAEIRGVDLREPLTRAALDEMETILARVGVVFFAAQDIDVEGHAALAQALGRPKLPPEYIPSLTDIGHPEICVLSTENQLAYASSLWHSDVTWDATPPKYSPAVLPGAASGRGFVGLLLVSLIAMLVCA